MGVSRTRLSEGSGFGHFEPEVSRQFLPGCRACGSAHPLAIKGNHDPDTCPGCGAPAGTPGETLTERAAMGFSPAILFGRTCMWIGSKLNSLSKRM